MTDPTPIDLTRQLREELGMFAGAMPITPEQAWEEALGVVRDLRSGRCWACHESVVADPLHLLAEHRALVEQYKASRREVESLRSQLADLAVHAEDRGHQIERLTAEVEALRAERDDGFARFGVPASTPEGET